MMRNEVHFNAFNPDAPVPPELFVGRKKEINLYQEALERTMGGQARNLMVVGEPGIGKTSFLHLVRGNYTPTDALAIYLSLGTSRTVDEACAAIIDKIYSRTKALSKRIKETLTMVQGFTVGPLGIQFVPTEKRPVLANQFPRLLEAIWDDHISKDYEALVIFWDEAHYLSHQEYFANFMKSLMEQLALDGYGKIMNVLALQDTELEVMIRYHGRITGVFQEVGLANLSEKETFELVDKALAESIPPKKAKKEFKDNLWFHSEGIPSFVHAIGWSSYEVDEDGILDFSDLAKGLTGTNEVKGAMEILWFKFFQDRYSRKIQSNTYRQVLEAMASILSDEIKVEEIREELERKKINLGNALNVYLGTMVKRGVIYKVEDKRGFYRMDRMFKLFLRLAAAGIIEKKR